MRTLMASAILSVMFLSAGAFAGNTHKSAPAAQPDTANVTVVIKNQAWPLAGRISVDPCALDRCFDI